MKKIGILGGMSYLSTLHYYQLINSKLNADEMPASFECIIYSVDFQKISDWQFTANLKAAEKYLLKCISLLEKTEPDIIIIASNTAHKFFDVLQAATDISILHIAEASANYIKDCKIDKLLMLSTKFTAESGFFENYFENYGTELIIPDRGDIEEINAIIFEELTKGIVSADSKQKAARILERYKIADVLLACTELSMLFDSIPPGYRFFDTLEIHVNELVKLIKK